MGNIIIDNLPESTTETELEELFVPFGEVRSAIIVRGITMRGRGLAFVDLDVTGVAGAIKALNGKQLQGKRIRVSPTRRQSDQSFAIRDVSPSW